jgi:hypothetical protein
MEEFDVGVAERNLIGKSANVVPVKIRTSWADAART